MAAPPCALTIAVPVIVISAIGSASKYGGASGPGWHLNTPIMLCETVMSTSQAEAFGRPNPFVGIAGFTAVTVVRAAVLRGRFRWFWIGIQVGVTFAMVFVHWLIYQSLYVNGALRPYCMIAWAVTSPLFWLITVQFLQPCFPLDHSESDALSSSARAILTAW